MEAQPENGIDLVSLIGGTLTKTDGYYTLTDLCRAKGVEPTDGNKRTLLRTVHDLHRKGCIHAIKVPEKTAFSGNRPVNAFKLIKEPT